MRKQIFPLLFCLLLFGCTPSTQEDVASHIPVVQEEVSVFEQTDEVQSAAVEQSNADTEKAEKSRKEAESSQEEEREPPAVAQPVQEDAPAAVPICTVSISCKKLLEQINLCDPDKVELLPKDGWILPPTPVEFFAGESVLDLLLRVCRLHGILMEYSAAPIYDSAYIEGIGNLYEFDGGPLSGWRYSVNGIYPNYGCSKHILHENDAVCWEYTCDLEE